MSEEFVQQRRYDLASLYRLEGELSRLHVCFQAWAANPSSGLRDLEIRREQVEKIVNLCGLKQATQRVKALGKKLASKSVAVDECRRECERLRFQVEKGLGDDDLLVVRLNWEAIDLKQCLRVETFFYSGVYDLLPLEAQLDFQEAGRCFLYEQHRAAVIMAFRAAEKVTKEYYYRLTDNNEKDQTFENMLRTFEAANNGGQIIPPTDRAILNKIFDVKESRNAYMHSGSTPDANDPFEMAGYLEDVAQLCSMLVRDLEGRNKLLAVAIEDTIDLDQAMALWLLKKNSGGIGRKKKFKGVDEERELVPGDWQYKIGGGAGDFKRSSDGFPDCIAWRLYKILLEKDLMEKNPQLNATYAPLIEFAARWRAKNDGVPIVDSNSQEETLEELNESLRLRHHKSLDKYMSEIWKLFDAILEGGLDPFNPHLSASLSNDFDSLVRQSKQRLESAAEATRETVYDGQRCLLIETRRPKTANEYMQRGFPYVFMRNAATYEIHVVSSEESVDWGSFFRQAVRYNLGFKTGQDGWQLQSKAPQPSLSLDTLKELVDAAEIARVV